VVFVSEHIENPLLRKLILYNPLTYLVDLPRGMLLGTSSMHWQEYFGATGVALAALLIGTKVFHLIQDLVAERL
jgi:lipopolysaccharide transport system permease protein